MRAGSVWWKGVVEGGGICVEGCGDECCGGGGRGGGGGGI